MSRSKRLFPLLGLVLLLSLAIAACGGGEEPADVVPTTADSVPPAVNVAPQVVVPELEASPTAADSPVPTSARTGTGTLAAELVGINGWINSEPFTLASQRGKVVLVDFWTYTCINCINTFHHLRGWQDKYAKDGLVIVGVHTPEFEFEKKRENVERAAKKHGLVYAIAQDNDYATWDAYKNRFWPAKYLIDKDGYIRYAHFGEGRYAETEMKIRELLMEAGSGLEGISLNLEPDPQRDQRSGARNPTERTTRELYAGTERNYTALLFGDDPYVWPRKFYEEHDADILYLDDRPHRNNFIHLEGLWFNSAESLTHARETENYEDYMAILFNAASVNVVMSPEGELPVEVRITIDEKPINAALAGADIKYDDDGNSYIFVDEERMYRVVDSPEFVSHDLKLSSNAGLSVFAFTFGDFVSQPGS